MFVINANDSKDTTNYMLADPGYPDLDSILMYGCPMADLGSLITLVGTTSPNPFIFTPSDIAVVDTIGTYPINMYCPKIDKQSLYSGNSVRTPLWGITDYRQYRPDFGLRDKNLRATSGSSKTTQKRQSGYNIAVKGLTAGQVVGEKIYAPIMLGGSQNCNESTFTTGNYVGYSEDAHYYANPIEITFKLLHSDGTTTSIATIVPKLLFGNYVSDTDPMTTQISSDGTTSSMVYKSLGQANSQFGYLMFEGSYNGVGQTAQAGDMLVAEVRLNLAIKANGSTSTVYNCAVGVYGGGTNNNNMRDVYGFRPFQVSIR